jgi:hypothetical protein
MALLPNIMPSNPILTRWKALLDTLLKNPLNAVIILPNQPLGIGNTVIDHKLGRNQQGWFLTDINGAATIYRSAPFNSSTLTLNSTAAVTVNIGVF